MKPRNLLSRIKLMLRQLSCREARSSNYLETLIFSFWFFSAETLFAFNLL